jgi:hypothetical protein
MSIKGILFSGAALCAISAAPAIAAEAPHMHIAAMHQGGVVKSAVHNKGATNVTYTFSVATSVSTASGYNVKTPLAATYYTFQSNSSICDAPKTESISISSKKTKYAKLGTSTETLSEGCSAPTVFYGDTYELTTKKAKNKTDTFSSTLNAKFVSSGTHYKGKLILDVSVAITK